MEYVMILRENGYHYLNKIMTKSRKNEAPNQESQFWISFLLVTRSPHPSESNRKNTNAIIVHTPGENKKFEFNL